MWPNRPCRGRGARRGAQRGPAGRLLDFYFFYVFAGAAPVGVWDADEDGYRREFVAKAIVVDPYASGPPACADYVWAAKDELDGYLADDAYLEFPRKLP